MSQSKQRRVDEIKIITLADETMKVIDEMLSIMVDRTNCDNNDTVHTGTDLQYFGVGHQIKISKLADTLYSTLKDVIVFVMNDMAKNSECDYKFQIPKHTSFVGGIVKNVAINVLAHHEEYHKYIIDLINGNDKYVFNVDDPMFEAIYRDTVLKLDECGYLFSDDPELMAIQQYMRGLPPLEAAIAGTNPLESIHLTVEDIIPASQAIPFHAVPLKQESVNHEESESIDDLNLSKASRNRVILPYLRRLFETRKSASVTLKRVESVISSIKVDDEVKSAFYTKYEELLNDIESDISFTQVTIREHCVNLALDYIRQHFPNERVEMMEQYIQSEKSINMKARKRYCTIPSGKRQRFTGEIKPEYTINPNVISQEAVLHISESSLTEDELSINRDPTYQAIYKQETSFGNYNRSNSVAEDVKESDYTAFRSNLSQPRPLNPDLDIHLNADSFVTPTIAIPFQGRAFPKSSQLYNSSSISNLKEEKQTNLNQRQDVNYQLVTIPSTSSSSSTSFSEIDRRLKETSRELVVHTDSSDINSYLKSRGLPLIDFNKMKKEDKDEFYQRYIREIASQYDQRETLLNTVSQSSFYNCKDQSAMDLLKEVNNNVCQILSDNGVSSRMTLIDNVQSIGKKMKKDKVKIEFLDEVMNVIDNDEVKPNSTVNYKTYDKEYDTKMDLAMKRLLHMRKYRMRYKSMLLIKYKVIELLSRTTGETLDRFLDDEKLIPLIEKYKFPLTRIKEILSSRAYTPEWKVRELKELFGMI